MLVEAVVSSEAQILFHVYLVVGRHQFLLVVGLRSLGSRGFPFHRKLTVSLFDTGSKEENS